jgi:hypothetical protein
MLGLRARTFGLPDALIPVAGLVVNACDKRVSHDSVAWLFATAHELYMYRSLHAILLLRFRSR